MTPDPYKAEYDYLLTEFLGLTCEDREPTPEQLREAHRVAMEGVRRLREQEERELKERLES